MISSLSISILLMILYVLAREFVDSSYLNTFLSFEFSLVVFFITTQLRANRRTFFIISDIYINLSIVLIAVDCIYRFANPDPFYLVGGGVLSNLMGSLSMYAYKTNSLLFDDSNTSAIYCIAVIMFLKWMSGRKKEKNTGRFILLWILLLLTLSRAALIATLLSMVFFILFSKSNDDKLVISKKRASVLFIVIVIIVARYGLYLFGKIKDASFLSKFMIINNAVKYYSTASLRQVLFGVGFGHSKDFLFGVASHIQLLSYAIDSGIIGMFLFIKILINAVKYNKYNLYIVLPFAIAGMSFSPYILTYLFFPIGLVSISKKID
jgi:hypothetical protein